MDDLIPISCRIPKHLARVGKTQQWLADHAGISKQQLSDYVNMRNLMGIIVAKRISDLLHIQIEDIYVWERQRSS